MGKIGLEQQMSRLVKAKINMIQDFSWSKNNPFEISADAKIHKDINFRVVDILPFDWYPANHGKVSRF